MIGDNGAGKSVMIKALSGALQIDGGEMWLDGKPYRFSSPLEARESGIETVYQNLALSPALSIADNMFMGREIAARGHARHGVQDARQGRDAAHCPRKADRNSG